MDRGSLTFLPNLSFRLASACIPSTVRSPEESLDFLVSAWKDVADILQGKEWEKKAVQNQDQARRRDR
jgi:hypothetical protein